jgi:mycothiol system anti-sigma-R factor
VAHAQTDCRTVLNRLYLYLDGEIAGDESTVIQLHLEECLSCMHHYGFEKDFKELIHRKCAGGAMPEGLTDRIKITIRRVLDE